MFTQRYLPALLLALLAGLLLTLPWLLAPSAPAQAAPTTTSPTSPSEDALSPFWQENFSTPILSTTYYITATPGSGIVNDASFLLTRDANNQRGRIFYLTPTLMADFTATFQINLGEENADGMAFLFCPSYDYPPQVGGALDATCPDGYIVAFDTYEEGGNRLYVAHDDTTQRLASAFLNIEANTWHTVEVRLRLPSITVIVDGEPLLNHVPLPGSKPFFGYFGFSAATGSQYNAHRVDEIKVYVPDASIKLWNNTRSRQLAPGESITYSLTLFNNLGITDSFTFSLGTHQWPTALSITQTGPLSDQTSLDFTVRVTVPQSTTLYEDKVIVQVTSVSSPTYTDTVTLHTDSRCRARLNDATETFASIQAAVDASTSPTDIVKVAGYCTRLNDYDGLRQVVYLSKSLTIQGGYTYTQWTTPDPLANPTTVDAKGEGRVFFITNTITPTLEMLRITGGDATGLGGIDWRDSGGGLYISRADATIRNCEIYGNIASQDNIGFGGGVAIHNTSNTTLISNTIRDNTSSTSPNEKRGYGGGIFIFKSHGVILDGNQINANTASFSGGYGGGIIIMESTEIHIQNNTLQANYGNNGSERGYGGGIAILESENVTLTTNTFLSNTAGSLVGFGGGTIILDAENITLTTNTFLSNTAGSSIGCGGGLAIWNEGHDILAISNTFRFNQGAGGDSPSSAVEGGGGGICVSEGYRLTFTANTLISNTASQDNKGYGGAIGLWETNAASMTNNFIQFNLGNAGSGKGQGGGIYTSYIKNLYLTQNTLDHNEARHDSTEGTGSGGALFIEESLHVTLTDNLIRDNIANHGPGYGIGGGIAIDSEVKLFLHDNTFLANIAATDDLGLGGAFSTYRNIDDETVHFSRNLFLSNTATLSPTAIGRGGGIYYDGSSELTGDNNVIARNHANTEGSALYLVGGGSLVHTTFADNRQAVGLYLEDASLQMTNTIIAGHTTGISGTNSVAIFEATLWYDNQADFITSAMTLTTTYDYTGNPAFVNPHAGNYHISNGSAAIDKGIPTSLHEDLDNAPRPCGKAPDLGADEICRIFLPLVLRNH